MRRRSLPQNCGLRVMCQSSCSHKKCLAPRSAIIFGPFSSLPNPRPALDSRLHTETLTSRNSLIEGQMGQTSQPSPPDLPCIFVAFVLVLMGELVVAKSAHAPSPR